MSTFVCQFHTGAIVILINEESSQLHTVHKATLKKKKRLQKEQLSILSWLRDVFGHKIHSQEWKLLQISELCLSFHLRVHCSLSTATFLSLVFCPLRIFPYTICIVSQWKVSHPCSPCWKCLPGPPSPPLLLLFSLLTLQFNFFLNVTIQSFLSHQ